MTPMHPIARSETSRRRIHLPAGFPTIITLCGSTRFRDAYEAANRAETLAGNIVISVGLFGHAEAMDMGGPVKAGLDALHLKKIDLADAILVVSVDGYIGASTRREIDYALATEKEVRWMEPAAEQTYREGCK